MKKKRKLNMLKLNRRLIEDLEQKEPSTKKVNYASQSTARDTILRYKIKNQF